MRYSILTFGCRQNQADSLAIEEQLRSAGASMAAPEDADLVLVNTCSVTTASDQGARQAIRRVARVNPGVRIVATGCYATRCPDEVASLPNVAGVVQNCDKPNLLRLVQHVRLRTDQTVVELLGTAERFGDGDGACGARIEPGLGGRTAYTLSVQTGCAEPCAYCVIPATRGIPRSVPFAATLDAIDRLVNIGFKEIVLTGVHLGSYGRELVPRSSLEALLTAIAGRWNGRERLRVRLSSLEPMDCSPAIVDLVASCECLAAHFHLPLQHASDRVLAAMRRPYTSAQYFRLVDDIRQRMPHASIGSDIIVGFPGESDDDFARLESYLHRSPLTHLHVFPYSDRPGTAASEMTGRIPGPIVRERAKAVRDASERLATRFRESQVGTVRRALTLEDGSLAVTDNYLKVRIPSGRPRNEWVRVSITGADQPGTMAGTVVAEDSASA